MRRYRLAGALALTLALLPASWACDGGAPDPDGWSSMTPCGMGDPSLPDFTLQDVRAASPTYHQDVSLSDFAGQVLMIFWMTAT